MIKLQKGHIIKIVKMILLELALALSAPAACKTQYFFYLSFNSTLQFINGILQKVFKYFNGTAIVAFLVTFALSASFFSNNFDLYSKGLKVLSLAISALKLIIHLLNKIINVLLFQNSLDYIIFDCTMAWLNVSLQHHLLFIHQFL